MTRLVVNPDTPEAWSQELPPGECVLGRAEGSTVVVDHPSVSANHCRLLVSESGAVLIDSGSTSGTYVRGELVERADLVPGSVFRLGQVQFRFESEAESNAPAQRQPVSDSPPGHGLNIGSGARCRRHPRAQADFFCGRCQEALCGLCVQTQRSPSGTRNVCKKCGTPCGPLSPAAAVSLGTGTDFLKALPGALIYPFKGKGLFLVLAGGILYLLLGFVPLIGLLTTGYLFNYAKSMVASSGMGEDEPPDWPDFANWFDDMVMPYLELIALSAVTFGPALLAYALLPGRPIVVATLVVLGALLAPMAMLALAMFDTVTALNPVALVWSILRIPGTYLIAAVPFGLFVAAYLYSDVIFNVFIESRIASFFIGGAVNLYFVAVAMRILGLLYRIKSQDLGWTRH